MRPGRETERENGNKNESHCIYIQRMPRSEAFCVKRMKVYFPKIKNLYYIFLGIEPGFCLKTTLYLPMLINSCISRCRSCLKANELLNLQKSMQVLMNKNFSSKDFNHSNKVHLHRMHYSTPYLLN